MRYLESSFEFLSVDAEVTVLVPFLEKVNHAVSLVLHELEHADDRVAPVERVRVLGGRGDALDDGTEHDAERDGPP